MESSSTYVEDWIRYWDNVGRTFTSRFRAASRDARRGRYGPTRLYSDTLALWAEGAEAWCAAVLGRGATAPAVVFLRIPHGTEFKLRTVRVPVPGDGDPEPTDLVHVGAPGALIPKDHVKIKV